MALVCKLIFLKKHMHHPVSMFKSEKWGSIACCHLKSVPGQPGKRKEFPLNFENNQRIVKLRNLFPLSIILILHLVVVVKTTFLSEVKSYLAKFHPPPTTHYLPFAFMQSVCHLWPENLQNFYLVRFTKYKSIL